MHAHLGLLQLSCMCVCMCLHLLMLQALKNCNGDFPEMAAFEPEKLVFSVIEIVFNICSSEI